ncbi:S8 family serine peptidase [Algoriphagus sp.]|uniref:S8 family serine peptidase n=1 Tax=Algoriphagus sp. TaxID=1872435 RepID=UPI0025DBA47E|nr:S8 family serine peptidase [Algoriphagus sp.]
MKNIFLIILSLFLFSAVFAQSEKRYVIKLKDKGVFTTADILDRDQAQRGNSSLRKMKKDKAENIARSKGVNKILKTFSDVEVGLVVEMNETQAEAIRRDSEIESVIEDFIMQGRPRMQARRPIMQGRPRMQEEYGYDIGAGTNCSIIEAGGGQQRNGAERNFIWIVDSGIDGSHDDLKKSINKSKKYAKSFVDNDPWKDGAGHGTFMAGLASAESKPNGNEFAMNGVAPGVPTVSLKVLDSNGEGFWSDIVLALDHVAQFGRRGDVVSMSLGAFGISNCADSNPILSESIRNLASKGIFIVMSAGNDGGDSNMNLPGCITGENIFTVGSIDFNCQDGQGNCSSFSNLGSNVNWVAPGNPVFSTFPGNEYQVWSGTSMSAAYVAGIIYASQGSPAVAGTVSCGGRTYSIPKIR